MNTNNDRKYIILIFFVSSANDVFELKNNNT